jgi:uncharacterized protein
MLKRTLFSLLVIAALVLSVVPMALPARVAQAAGGGSGSISLTTLNTAYTQNFDTLANSGTTNILTINGWYLDESGTGTANNGQYAGGTGSSTTGDTYSFGASGSNERAFGGLLSGSLNPTIGASFTNNTGQTVTSLDISYTGEMWRAGVTNRGAADRLDFQLSTNTTSLTTGTWTDYNSLDFNSPNLAATSGALNGNSATNQTTVSYSITGLSIPSGSTFWIRWRDFDISSSDDGLAVDSFSITPRIIDFAPEVVDTFPDNGATDFPINANLSVTFSEPVNVTSPWFTLTCSVSGPSGVATTYSGGPTTFTLDPSVALTDGETCTLTILSSQVTDQDGNDPPDNMVMNFVVGFSPFDVCVAPFTPIYTIQGSGLVTSIPGPVTTKGVVVGDFEGSNSVGIQGFYLQDLTGDGDPATSDGIFVYTGNSNLVSVGQVVRVTGYARERFDQTTINGSNSDSSAVPAANIVSCGSGGVAPIDVFMPFANPDEPERFEGMLVRFPQSLVIAEYFNYDRFGEMVIALPYLPGESRPFTGTAIDEPGAPANERTYQNSLRRITLDDGLGSSNPPVLRHPNGDPFSLTNRFRGGDTVANTVGVLGYDFGMYRIQPTGAADYAAENLRPTAPEPVGGTVRVAAMNTLNFFVTADYPTGNPLDNKCGPLQNVECRGWDSDQPDEFTRQRTKLLAALSGLNADIIGLNELENTTGVEPLDSIVAGLLGYAYINTGTIGTDAIKVGMIYRPVVVTPVGSFKLLTSAVDPRFIDTKSRPSLAQTFLVNATGARFTMVVNHFKSKGSDCIDVGDPDLGDGQGNCGQTRKLAAQALVDWLATDPTGSGDPDYIIMGDLNSYAQEDTIDAIKAGPDDAVGTSDDYTNLIAHFQEEPANKIYAYSYTFDGQAGYLDHALASASMFGQVKGAADWHINSDEPDVLDYDTSFKPPEQDALYEPNAYRTSDHDPVLVGLNLVNYPPELGDITVSPSLAAVGTAVNASAPFTDPDMLDTHTATWDWGDGNTSTGIVTENLGVGTITGSHPYATPGVYKATVTVDDGYGNTDTAVYEFVVVYDPNGGFVTGGGWIMSPEGAYTADPSLMGKATFGFVAKYQKGANVPVGNTEFQFKVGNLNFKSTSYEWLVVAGSKAQFKGEGIINGEGLYKFMITAADSNPDTFRIKIWYEVDGVENGVYDNSSQQVLGGGSIVVHK